MSKDSMFASSSVPRHLLRGAIGFGLLASSFALVPTVGPVALGLAPLGLVALRGCPMCWVMGLVETVTRGRVERTCVDGQCRLTTSGTADASPVSFDDAYADEHGSDAARLSSTWPSLVDAPY
ncbi:hypothetical protein [Frankia sp. Cppng1_Ct_nod]|uniref:hypothetical protein n=1 Tax=Frankia sp. Cppng1_Ct_nod TaxID=2897162 RepID=UPI001A93BAF4|nr:hypothetical protein [Frankia sp. Cppng1_Ct_nod]